MWRTERASGGERCLFKPTPTHPHTRARVRHKKGTFWSFLTGAPTVTKESLRAMDCPKEVVTGTVTADRRVTLGSNKPVVVFSRQPYTSPCQEWRGGVEGEHGVPTKSLEGAQLQL